MDQYLKTSKPEEEEEEATVWRLVDIVILPKEKRLFFFLEIVRSKLSNVLGFGNPLYGVL
jgi:hypothetical protein